MNLLQTLKYRYFVMYPLNVVSILFSSLLLCAVPKLRSFPALAVLCLIIVCGSLTLNFATKQKRLNDYLISVSYPFNHYFYLFQSVRKGRSIGRLTPSQIKESYLSQMRQALDQLPPGQYKTVTQPMFTRAIQKSPKITILHKEKAYQKKIGPLMRRIYAPCVCSKLGHKKQFYFIDFQIK